MTIIAITNPSDEAAEAGFVTTNPDFLPTPERILEAYGSKLEDGAQVTFVEGARVWQYIATRDPNATQSIALRSNNALAAAAGDAGEEFISYVADRDPCGSDIIATASIKLESEVELETFTVFGENDDGDQFRAVVTATDPAAAKAAGIQAGLVDPGFERDVSIAAVLKGDVTDADVTPEASEG